MSDAQPRTTFADPPAAVKVPAPEAPPADDGPSDADLARLAEGGDQAAFGELYRRHGRSLWIVLHRLFPRSPELLDEAYQAAWAKAWEYIAKFTYGSFGAWLVRIGRNHALTMLRPTKTVSIDAPGVVEPAADEPTGEANEARRAALAECIKELLDEDEKEFLRKRVADNGYDDMLAAEGIKPGHADYKNARGRLYGRFNRIKDKLTTCVEGKLG